MCTHMASNVHDKQVIELRRESRLLELALPSGREVTVQRQPSVFGGIAAAAMLKCTWLSLAAPFILSLPSLFGLQLLNCSF